MSGLPKLTQRARPFAGGDYAGRYARTKKVRRKERHPREGTSPLVLMPSTVSFALGSSVSSPLVDNGESKAPAFLSYLVLVLSMCSGLGFCVIHFDALRESGFYPFVLGFSISGFLLANAIFLITESIGGKEMRFRRAFVLGTWGAATFSLGIGFIIRVIDGPQSILCG